MENIDPQHHAEKPRNLVKAPGHKIVDGAALQTRGNDARRHGQYDAEGQQNHIFELRAEITQETAEGLLPVLGLFCGRAEAGSPPPEALLGGSGLYAHAVASSRSWES